MTTDITELAQSLKAAAENAIGAHERLAAYPYGEIIDISQHEGEQIDIDITDLNEFNKEANPVNILALLEALEKAQTINAAAEKLVRCKGRYHSEQNYRALAALFGVTTPDLPPLEHENVHYADAAEMEIAALRQRIAELESRTVKLPDLRQIVSGDRYVWSDGVYNYSQDVKVALAAAGIKVEVE
ncbi:TPA: ead/Ea22-like family protein [Klebsiella pneumoniae]|nr:ead/Ea22-like family protein [Klebsiella pneumoniae]